tara:strand:+ start:1892 stop:2065 length:174 start_codon:yes stop_codon:yes gene_type:complete
MKTVLLTKQELIDSLTEWTLDTGVEWTVTEHGNEYEEINGVTHMDITFPCAIEGEAS